MLKGERLSFFHYSHIPELNQLLLPFLTLVTNAELDRNPTVKEEILASGQKRINAGMYTYLFIRLQTSCSAKGMWYRSERISFLILSSRG